MECFARSLPGSRNEVFADQTVIITQRTVSDTEVKSRDWDLDTGLAGDDLNSSSWKIIGYQFVEK